MGTIGHNINTLVVRTALPQTYGLQLWKAPSSVFWHSSFFQFICLLYTLFDSDVASWFATSAVQHSISVLYSKHVVIIHCPRGAAPVVRYGTIARALLEQTLEVVRTHFRLQTKRKCAAAT